MSIALQLKSTQRKADLDDISHIIKIIDEQHGYKIRGHEIQQLAKIVASADLSERVKMVSDFCSKNEIEYLTYHTQIFENGENIGDDKWNRVIRDSILQSIEEADLVRRGAGIKNDDAVIVFHLTGYLPKSMLPTVTRGEKLELQSKAEKAFLQFYKEERIAGRKGIVMAVENSYPKYYPHHAIAGPFHPAEIARLEGHGIKTVLDLSHYHLYSNYLRYGQGNLLGDLDREIYDPSSPSWQECIQVLSKSLVQLHISDAKGFDSAGEGLPLGKGEIPIAEILQHVHSSLNRRIIRGTLELHDGHLYNGRLQLDGVRWLLNNVPQDVFL
jgi:hypothetical protein